ncbi:MAG: LuxR C-terminal-related transcriptional regulator [Edaphobacter sp.]
MGGSEQQPKHRMRILLCACNASDAQRALKYGHSMEVTFLPSYDLEEIRREISRFKPKLITCSTNVFLHTSSFQPPNVPRPNNQSYINKTLATAFVTPRETKVLAMLEEGKTNDEIARALHLSARTVKRTLSGLFERLEATNRTELTSRAAKLRLLVT